jgi:hypothetical protein
LIHEVAVDRHEDIDTSCCDPEKLAVLLSRPSGLGHGLHLCSLRCFFNPRGRHSSSSTRISCYRFAGDVKYGGDLFPADRRKIVKEIVHTIPDLQIIHQRLDWNAGSIEDGRPREDLRVDTDRRLE